MILDTISKDIVEVIFSCQTTEELDYIVYSKSRVVGVENVDATTSIQTYRTYVAMNLQ